MTKPNANTTIKSLIFLILAPALCFAQGARFDSNVFTVPGSVPPGAYPPVLAVPGATFAVCADSACASSAATYTDLTLGTACPSNAPVTLPGSPACVTSANAQGAFGFNIIARNTWYKITFPNGATFGPFAITPGGGGGGGVPGGAPLSIQFNNNGVFGGFGSFDPGDLITTFPAAATAPIFNCTQTGSAACVQQDLGTFVITGAGNIAAQSLVVTNGIKVGAGAYGFTGSGALNVSSCTGCGGGSTPSGPGNSVQFSNSTATAFSGSAGFIFSSGTTTLSVGASAGQGIVNAGLLQCTATGTNTCIQAQTGAWAITGAGGILGSYLSLANGWTAGGGAYGLTSAGALNVASCTGCAVSTYCQAAGTNTITCAGIPPPVAYAAGQSVIILIAVTNTGATTLNINSLGAKAIHSAGMALAGGELVAGNLYTLFYDGTQFNLGSPPGLGVTSFNTRSGAVTLIKADVTAVDQALAPGDSPTFSALTITNNATATEFISSATGTNTSYSNGGTGGTLAAIYADGHVREQWLLLDNQGSPPTAAAGSAFLYATTTNLFTAFNGGSYLQVTNTIQSGTATLGTSAISAGTCASAVTVSAAGVATTDTLTASPNGNPTGITGYTPGASLYVWAYPTSGNVNFIACNSTASPITPAAITFNWRVQR